MLCNTLFYVLSIKACSMSYYILCNIKPIMTSSKETQTENDSSLKCIECNFDSVSTEEWKWQNHEWTNIVETTIKLNVNQV